ENVGHLVPRGKGLPRRGIDFAQDAVERGPYFVELDLGPDGSLVFEPRCLIRLGRLEFQLGILETKTGFFLVALGHRHLVGKKLLNAVDFDLGLVNGIGGKLSLQVKFFLSGHRPRQIRLENTVVQLDDDLVLGDTLALLDPRLAVAEGDYFSLHQGSYAAGV